MQTWYSDIFYSVVRDRYLGNDQFECDLVCYCFSSVEAKRVCDAFRFVNPYNSYRVKYRIIKPNLPDSEDDLPF